MPIIMAKTMGIALRRVTSMGLMPAIPATMMVAPAIGDMVRPRVPPKVAMEPICTMDIPKSAAWGVTASLNAKVAASPEPVIRPVKERLGQRRRVGPGHDAGQDGADDHSLGYPHLEHGNHFGRA